MVRGLPTHAFACSVLHQAQQHLGQGYARTEARGTRGHPPPHDEAHASSNASSGFVAAGDLSTGAAVIGADTAAVEEH